MITMSAASTSVALDAAPLEEYPRQGLAAGGCSTSTWASARWSGPGWRAGGSSRTSPPRPRARRHLEQCRRHLEAARARRPLPRQSPRRRPAPRSSWLRAPRRARCAVPHGMCAPDARRRPEHFGSPCPIGREEDRGRCGVDVTSFNPAGLAGERRARPAVEIRA
jgi:hypothetical protein